MKYLNISDLESASGSSIWVLNNTEAMGTAKGVINFTVFGASNGRPTSVQIPATSIPIDLTTQATFAAITESPDFRRLIIQRMIFIISSEDAQTLLSDPQAQKEQARVYSVLKNAVPFSSGASPEAVAMAGEAEDNVHPIALMIANTDERDEDSLRNLDMNKSLLAPTDLQYIASRSSNARIKQKAAEILTSRNV